MEHYFENDKPHIFNRHDDKDQIKEKFDEFIGLRWDQDGKLKR